MNYTQFLQVPYTFVLDCEKVLRIKNKWDLPLTRYEKMLQKHIVKFNNEMNYE
jgi:hypothetical protein